jgi:hypothetical protein
MRIDTSKKALTLAALMLSAVPSLRADAATNTPVPVHATLPTGEVASQILANFRKLGGGESPETILELVQGVLLNGGPRSIAQVVEQFPNECRSVPVHVFQKGVASALLGTSDGVKIKYDGVVYLGKFLANCSKINGKATAQVIMDLAMVQSTSAAQLAHIASSLPLIDPKSGVKSQLLTHLKAPELKLSTLSLDRQANLLALQGGLYKTRHASFAASLLFGAAVGASIWGSYYNSWSRAKRMGISSFFLSSATCAFAAASELFPGFTAVGMITYSTITVGLIEAGFVIWRRRQANTA